MGIILFKFNGKFAFCAVHRENTGRSPNRKMMMNRLFMSLVLFMMAVTVNAASLSGVRLSQDAATTRLVLDLSSATPFKTFTLSNPDRLVIDLDNISQLPQLYLPSLADTPINNIRYAEKADQSLRIVLDLSKSLTYQAQSLPPNQGYPYRIVIDLNDGSIAKSSQPAAPVAAADPAPAPAPAPAITPVKSRKSLPKKDIVIAIDAGHGGQDSGALGPSGTKEKDVVLAIAKRLANLVNKEPGMRAYLTRDRDVFISLRQRIQRARKHGADMFISIHADAFHKKSARGSSVYVLSQRGASSEAAQILADRENAADLAGGISLEDKDDLLASVLLDLSQTASLEASLEVGNTVLSGLKRVGHVHKKHVESAAFVVLKSPDIPSILVETAFISNPTEERKLRSASHQIKLANAMMTGIRSYFKRNPPPGYIADQEHIVSRGDTLSNIAQRYRVSLAALKSTNKLTSNKLTVGEVLRIP
jgi:N-acetylmuramoyl-L-alanine amidase